MFVTFLSETAIPDIVSCSLKAVPLFYSRWCYSPITDVMTLRNWVFPPPWIVEEEMRMVVLDLIPELGK